MNIHILLQTPCSQRMIAHQISWYGHISWGRVGIYAPKPLIHLQKENKSVLIVINYDFYPVRHTYSTCIICSPTILHLLIEK